jgi:uncharacterized protein YegL
VLSHLIQRLALGSRRRSAPSPTGGSTQAEVSRSPRLLVALVVDATQTMIGHPSAVAQAALVRLQRDVTTDPFILDAALIAAITFGDDAVRAWHGPHTLPSDVSPFVAADAFRPPPLSPAGSGSLLNALDFTITSIEAERTRLRQAGLNMFRPVIWIISDGVPAHPRDKDTHAVGQAAAVLAEAQENRRLTVFVAGVGGGASRRPLLTSLAPAAYVDAEDVQLSVVLTVLTASVSTQGRDVVALATRRLTDRFGTFGD